MKKSMLVRIGIAAVGLALAGLVPASRADESGLKLETLLSAELQGVENTEVIVSRTTMPPNTVLSKHWHPGEEFAYVLEGAVTLRLEGEADVTATAGDVVVVPLKKVHAAITGDEGATVLVFRVHEQGKPERYPVE